MFLQLPRQKRSRTPLVFPGISELPASAQFGIPKWNIPESYMFVTE